MQRYNAPKRIFLAFRQKLLASFINPAQKCIVSRRNRQICGNGNPALAGIYRQSGFAAASAPSESHGRGAPGGAPLERYVTD
jgi:hypothetical protein